MTKPTYLLSAANCSAEAVQQYHNPRINKLFAVFLFAENIQKANAKYFLPSLRNCSFALILAIMVF